MTNQHRLLAAMVLVIGLFLTAQPANASTIPVGIGAFGAGSTLTTFNGQTNLGEVNGTTVDGILYQYSLGNGALVFNGGPGVTNNISPLNIVSGFGANSGVLTLTLPSPVDTFGYGYAILTNVTVPATLIVLFDGATLVGSQVYVGTPDPVFTGGFAGIQMYSALQQRRAGVQQRRRPGVRRGQRPNVQLGRSARTSDVDAAWQRICRRRMATSSARSPLDLITVVEQQGRSMRPSLCTRDDATPSPERAVVPSALVHACVPSGSGSNAPEYGIWTALAQPGACFPASSPCWLRHHRIRFLFSAESA